MSRLEPFLQSKLGYDILLYSCSGVLINYPGSQVIQQLKALIINENVSQLTIVVDTDCTFLNTVRKPAYQLGLPTEKWLLGYYTLPLNFSNLSEYDQQFQLATWHVQEQGKELYTALKAAFLLCDVTLELNGWVTTSRSNRIQEIEFDFIKNDPYGF
jgi:hypothetical protein